MATNSPRITLKRQFCCVPNCFNRCLPETDVKFFSFPTDEERCKKWIQNARRLDLINKSAFYLASNHVICNAHFDASQYQNNDIKKSLIKSAIPNVFKFPETPKTSVVEGLASSVLKERTTHQEDCHKEIKTGTAAAVAETVVKDEKIIVADKSKESRDTMKITPSPKIEDSPTKPQGSSSRGAQAKASPVDANDSSRGCAGESSIAASASVSKRTSKRKSRENEQSLSERKSKKDAVATPSPNSVLSVTPTSLDQGKRVKNEAVSPKESSVKRRLLSTQVEPVDVELILDQIKNEKTLDEKEDAERVSIKRVRQSRGRPRISDDFIYDWSSLKRKQTDEEKETVSQSPAKAEVCGMKRANRSGDDEAICVTPSKRIRGKTESDFKASTPKSSKKKETAPGHVEITKPLPGRPVKRKVGPGRPVKKKAEPGRPVIWKVEPGRPVKKKVGPGRPVKKTPEPESPVKKTPEPESPVKKVALDTGEEVEFKDLSSSLEVKNECEDSFSSPMKITARVKKERNEGFTVEENSYVVLVKGTQRGSKRLIGSDGYTYNIRVRRTNAARTDWRCSHRPKKTKPCNVVIRQYKDTGTFMKRGVHPHHPRPTAFISSLVSSQLKKKSKSDFVTKPKEVIEEILRENAELINEYGCKFNIDYLVRNFNRGRLLVKKKNPSANHKFDGKFPEGFLQQDILFKNSRCMVFATAHQLRLLARADRWYIDITRKFVSRPFTHLLSISAFVLVEDPQQLVKLKPLVFVTMNSVEKKDFEKVMRGLLRHLRKPLVVRSFVLDYYESLWNAIRSLFFNCKIFGCAWKFGQCLWSKIQQLGLQEEQMEMYDQIHKLLKLPFLPPKEIPLTFQLLKDEFLNRPSFTGLVNYMESTWMENPAWRISNWTVYANTFRTKAEVISWHYSVRLQEKGPHQNLVKELHNIAMSLSTSVSRPVHQPNVRRFFSENLKTPQGKIFNLWDEESVMSHSEFLTKCCQLSEPVMDGMVERMVQEYRMQMKEYS